MARPIKETPILKGKDAVEFDKAMKEAEGRKVSTEEFQRAKAVFEKIVQNSPDFVK